MAVRQQCLPAFNLTRRCTIDKQIESFKLQVVLMQFDRNKIQKKIIHDLKPFLLKAFRSSCVHVFGSMKYGVTLIGSDLDVFVKIDPKYQNNENYYWLSEELQGDKHFDEVEAILHANVPIIRTTHLPTETMCDLSFIGEFQIEHAELIKYYLNLHPRFYDVMLVIKFWAKKNGICDGKESISSYGWALMFICFLQTLKDPYGGPGLVKSVFELQKTKLFGRRVGDFLVEFDRQELGFHLPNDRRYSHVALLYGFFDYYRMHSFEAAVLCPYLGKPVTRVGSPRQPELPRKVASHVANLRKNTHMITGEYLRIVQYPLDHREKGYVVCKKKSLSKVNVCISRAAHLCAQYMQYSIDHDSMFLEQLFS